MAKETFKDYTDFELNDKMQSTSSLLGGYSFTDSIAFDQEYEGAPGKNILWDATQIRKKTYEDTTAGIWLGVDTDGKAKLNVGDGTNFFQWNGTALLVTGDLGIDGQISMYDGSDFVANLSVSFDTPTNVGTFSITDALGNIFIQHTLDEDSPFNTTDRAAGWTATKTSGTTIITTPNSTSVDNLITAQSSTAATSGGVKAIVIGSNGNFGIYWGSGVPTISAAQGSLYLRTDGSGVSSRAYINTNGSTTWTAINTVA